MRRIDGNSKAKLAGMVMAIALFCSTGAAAQAQRHILVSIPDRKLALIEDGQVVKTYEVAVGAAVSPTPTGTFTIVNRLEDPTYYHTGKVIGPGADNPLGPRWMGLSQKGFGIHGTNVPSSIGKAASHGCVRMRNQDVKEFFTLVQAGDTVEIRGERDAQTAAIFGEQPAIVAQAGTAAGAR